MRKDTQPLIREIKDFVKKSGSQKDAARRLGISAQYLCDILKDRKPISDYIAGQFGFVWKLEKQAASVRS